MSGTVTPSSSYSSTPTPQKHPLYELYKKTLASLPASLQSHFTQTVVGAAAAPKGSPIRDDQLKSRTAALIATLQFIASKGGGQKYTEMANDLTRAYGEYYSTR